MSTIPQIDPDTLRRQLAIAIPPPQPSMAVPSVPAGNAPPVLSSTQKQASLDSVKPAPQGVQMSSPAAPSLPAPSPLSIKAPRGSIQGDQEARANSLQEGPGIENIAHKIEGTQFGQNHPLLGKIAGYGLQVPAMIGDIAAETASPISRLALSHVPGTFAHQADTLRGENQAIDQDVTNEAKQAQTAGLNAEVPLRQAQTEEAQARTKELENPKESWEQVTGFAGPNGEPLEREKSSGHWRIAEGVPGAKSIEKLPEGERPLGNADNLNAALQDRYQVLNPGKPLPDQYKLPANATQKDYERIDKALGGVESAQGTKEQRAQTQAMREQAMAIASQNRSEKQDTATKQAAFKAYTPAMDSAERFNVMAKNYEDAVKDHDQQAMLSLLANHLGMTMGLQKGARMNKDIIQEAQNSRPWLQGMKAKFDKDGILQGVTLTVPQMQQMVNLGRERFAEDISKAGNEAHYLGSTDSGPERTPNKSVINHYLGLANGDVQKAKALAAQDGWTVK